MNPNEPTEPKSDLQAAQAILDNLHAPVELRASSDAEMAALLQPLDVCPLCGRKRDHE